MNRLSLLVLGLAVSTFASVGNLYWRSPDALPYKASFEKQMVVKVIVMRPDDAGNLVPVGHGSGVRIRENAIITCAHVARDASVVIEYADGSHEIGLVAVRNKQADLAVIQVRHPWGKVAKVGSSVTVGEPVTAIGNPMTIEWNVTAGIVSAIEETATVSDVVINPGNSGGGLFNGHMELVGIAQAIAGPVMLGAYQGHSMFIPPYRIKAILKKYDRLVHENKLGQEIETGSVQ